MPGPVSAVCKCGKPLPKKRLAMAAAQDIAGIFCSDSCNIKYGNEFLRICKTAEDEAYDEYTKENGDWKTVVQEKIDEAFREGQSPAKVLRIFAVKVGGHYGPQFVEGVFNYAMSMVKKRPKPTKKEPEGSEPPPKSTEGSGPPPTAKGPPPLRPRPRPAVPPKPKVTSEPKDLDSLPLEVQREWLLKRFTKLAPGASNEQIKKEYFRLCKVLHPDKAGNDPRVRAELSHRMSHLNSTYDKIREIDKDLGEEWPS